MGDRGLSEILEAEQYFVGRFADLADCLQARGRQHVPYACGKSNVFDQGIVRQFRRRIDETSFAHFFAFSSSSARLSL
jgi:hypothetical protein